MLSHLWGSIYIEQRMPGLLGTSATILCRTPGENAALRCLWGVLGNIAGNAYAKFWPDVKKKAFQKR